MPVHFPLLVEKLDTGAAEQQGGYFGKLPAVAVAHVDEHVALALQAGEFVLWQGRVEGACPAGKLGRDEFPKGLAHFAQVVFRVDLEKTVEQVDRLPTNQVLTNRRPVSRPRQQQLPGHTLPARRHTQPQLRRGTLRSTTRDLLDQQGNRLGRRVFAEGELAEIVGEDLFELDSVV
jgi:hypothetical protein